MGSSAPRLPGRRLCLSCGAGTTDPWPDDIELARAYETWYRPSSGRFSGPGDRLLRRTRGLLARRLDEIAPPGQVLDVGAGDGALLDALRATGRGVLGLERDGGRPDMSDATLEELRPSFAAIVFWHSLEHLREPGAAIARAAELLAPGGVLVVAVPNAHSLQAGAFGARWLALDFPRHLVHLPARALLARLKGLGLTVERVDYLRGGQVVFGWLHGLVGLLPGHPDLYDAIRRPSARSRPMTTWTRVGALLGAAALLPVAALLAVLEALLRRGGTVYVEARREGQRDSAVSEPDGR